MRHVGDHVAKGGSVSGHFQTYVEAFHHAEFDLHVLEALFARIDGHGDAEVASEIEAVRIHVRDDHMARARMLRHRRGHNSDRTSAGNKHVLTKHGEGERGVDGVAERIEDACDFRVHSIPVHPHVGHGERNVFGEGARPIDSDAAGVRAKVTAAGEAVAASPANDVAFAADDLARKEVGDIGANGDNFAHELMANRHGHRNGAARPIVPVQDVDVGAADGGSIHADQNVVDADLRDGNFFEPEAGLWAGLNEGFHQP